MRVKEESEKAGLKLNIQKTKIMASSPITSWQINGETMETVRDFIFLDSKITGDGDCSHEIKRCLLLGRTSMTNLDSILKSRDITLLTKVCIVKAMAFPVVMYGCESWSIKKAVCWRTDVFELLCWTRPLRVPWTARRSNQSILSIHWKDCCWSTALILWLPDSKSQLTGKDPDAGKDWRWEKATAEGEMAGWHHQLNGHELTNSGRWWGTGKPDSYSPWRGKESDKTEQLNNNNPLTTS